MHIATVLTYKKTRLDNKNTNNYNTFLSLLISFRLNLHSIHTSGSIIVPRATVKNRRRSTIPHESDVCAKDVDFIYIRSEYICEKLHKAIRGFKLWIIKYSRVFIWKQTDLPNPTYLNLTYRNPTQPNST